MGFLTARCHPFHVLRVISISFRMVIPNQTNVLFVPYRPSYSSKQSSVKGQGISQQKHAAREYHRKVKLQRLATKTDPTNKGKSFTKIDINLDPSTRSSRSILPRENTFLNGEGTKVPHTIIEVGAEQWDPFHVCLPEGIPNYVLEMLDHGKSSEIPRNVHLLSTTFSFIRP